MQRVLGIGGVFFKAKDPKALAEWYRQNLGVPLDAGQTYGTFASSAAGEPTVWATFPRHTEYFGPNSTDCMINYRVADLEAFVAQLAEAGIEHTGKIEEYEYGKFAWIHDPEGNRIELWQPLP